MRCKLLGLLLLIGWSAHAPCQTVERRTSMAPAARGDALLRARMLDAHNAARRGGRAAAGLGRASGGGAASYAATLAREDRFDHALQESEGENLWMGTRDAYALDEMVGGWITERRYYRAAATPNFSTTGNWGDVAHYTQIVWHSATALGCALASNHDSDVLVCRYSPPGNVVGELAF